MTRKGFTLLEITFAVAILSMVLLILFGISEAFGNTAQVQRAKVQATEECRRAILVAVPLLRQAARVSVNSNQLPGPVITFRPAADVNGNGTAVDVSGNLELADPVTIRVDNDDANGDGVTGTQLVMIRAGEVRVLANHLVPQTNGPDGQPTRETSGFWIAPRDTGLEVTVRARGLTQRGLALETTMSEYVVPRN